MLQFFKETGITGGGKQKRYLWTDAFALCNAFALSDITGDRSMKETGLKLIESVHSVLGKHRGDDHRSGWISGLDGENAQAHPTSGGLRIGKPMPERGSHESFDPMLEWDRDGQYYHYLTKWMHALIVAGKETGTKDFFRWAAELAKTAHEHFTYSVNGKKRMYWKMSIDLSRPLVPSMGHHDPMDGFITYCEINDATDEDVPDIPNEIEEMRDMLRGMDWTTEDPLGIGGLLFDTFRLVTMTSLGKADYPDILINLLDASLSSLRRYSRQSKSIPPSHRLAFRELGLSISLHTLPIMENLVRDDSRFEKNRSRIIGILDDLKPFFSLAQEIEAVWLLPKNRSTRMWQDHWEINTVMLATSLAPKGFLTI